MVVRAWAVCKITTESHVRQKADNSDETLQGALGPSSLLKQEIAIIPNQDDQSTWVRSEINPARASLMKRDFG